jgi:hypothetical protein
MSFKQDPTGALRRGKPMNVNLKKLDVSELKPRITIFGVGAPRANVR